MLKLVNTNSFWSFYAACIFLFYSTVLTDKVIVLVLWFTLFFIFKLTKLSSQLPIRSQQLYFANNIIYPIVFTWIRWMMVKNIIPDAWFWLNRLEHFFASLALAILLLPLFINVWKYSKWWLSLIFIVSLISLAGNFNEFIEYFLRLYSGSLAGSSDEFYYQDTIYDMIMNIIGSLFGYLILRFVLISNPLIHNRN